MRPVRLHQNAMVLHIDNRPVPGTGIDIIDMEKVKQFFLNVYDIDFKELDDTERKKILLNSCIMTESDSKIFATITGLLFLLKKKICFFQRLNDISLKPEFNLLLTIMRRWNLFLTVMNVLKPALKQSILLFIKFV
jgi:hypothetical protein